MCAVIFALICSICATVFVGSLAWDSDNKALLETYKLCLSFTLIGTAGTVVKAIVDTTMEEEREKKRTIAEHDKENERRYEAWENTRIKILREFIEIFSTFYSLRKLYHSAYSKSNSIYSKETDEYKSLIRECLKKATDLEGRFGVLKVLIIGHFDLPVGEFEHRPIEIRKVSADAILREVCKKLEIEGVSTHSFRRTALTRMSDAGVPLRHIQAISGHKTLSALERYLGVTEQQKESAISTLDF